MKMLKTYHIITNYLAKVTTRFSGFLLLLFVMISFYGCETTTSDNNPTVIPLDANQIKVNINGIDYISKRTYIESSPASNFITLFADFGDNIYLSLYFDNFLEDSLASTKTMLSSTYFNRNKLYRKGQYYYATLGSNSDSSFIIIDSISHYNHKVSGSFFLNMATKDSMYAIRVRCDSFINKYLSNADAVETELLYYFEGRKIHYTTNAYYGTYSFYAWRNVIDNSVEVIDRSDIGSLTRMEHHTYINFADITIGTHEFKKINGGSEIYVIEQKRDGRWDHYYIDSSKTSTITFTSVDPANQLLDGSFKIYYDNGDSTIGAFTNLHWTDTF